MSLISRMRKQKAVWWARSGEDEYGATTYATPVEVDCRWEDSAQQFIATDGSVQVSASVVYVDRVMGVGDVLLLGELTSSVTEDDPKGNAGAGEVRQFATLPNLRNTENLYTAFL